MRGPAGALPDEGAGGRQGGWGVRTHVCTPLQPGHTRSTPASLVTSAGRRRGGAGHEGRAGCHKAKQLTAPDSVMALSAIGTGCFPASIACPRRAIQAVVCSRLAGFPVPCTHVYPRATACHHAPLPVAQCTTVADAAPLHTQAVQPRTGRLTSSWGAAGSARPACEGPGLARMCRLPAAAVAALPAAAVQRQAAAQQAQRTAHPRAAAPATPAAIAAAAAAVPG